MTKTLINNGIGIYNKQRTAMTACNQMINGFELPVLKIIAVAKYAEVHKLYLFENQ